MEIIIINNGVMLSFTAQQVYMTESPPPYPGIEPTAPPQPMNGHPQESAAGRCKCYITLSNFMNKNV